MPRENRQSSDATVEQTLRLVGGPTAAAPEKAPRVSCHTADRAALLSAVIDRIHRLDTESLIEILPVLDRHTKTRTITAPNTEAQTEAL